MDRGLVVLAVILLVVGILVAGGFWYYYTNGHSVSFQSPTSNMSNLTANSIQSLKTSSNDPSGDYFIGSPDEQKKIVSAFVADNSRSDPTYLYIAADTAYRIGDIKDAGFLFYAAQIRKHFDTKRYALGDANGNNVQTYWGFLNETVG